MFNYFSDSTVPNLMYTLKQFMRLLLCLILPVLISCEYELTDIYEPERDEDRPPPEIVVHELSFQEDTIFAYSSQLLSFRFSTLGEEEILGVRVLLDQMEYEVIHDSVGSAGFNHEFLRKGPHQVDLEIYTTSETGSIADQLKEEQYVFKSGWVLYIVKDYFNLQTSVVDGILQLEWEEFLGSDFMDYGIAIGLNPLYHVVDNTYQVLGHIGQREEYKIWAMTDGDRNYQMGYQTINIDYPTIKRSMTDSSTYYIHWTKPTYYGALEKIQLWEDIVFGPAPSHTLVKETNDFNDTIFHVKDIEHNQLRSYQLILFGKYPRHPFQEDPMTGGTNASFTYFTQ